MTNFKPCIIASALIFNFFILSNLAPAIGYKPTDFKHTENNCLKLLKETDKTCTFTVEQKNKADLGWRVTLEKFALARTKEQACLPGNLNQLKKTWTFKHLVFPRTKRAVTSKPTQKELSDIPRKYPVCKTKWNFQTIQTMNKNLALKGPKAKATIGRPRATGAHAPPKVEKK